MASIDKEIYFDHAATTPLDIDVFKVMSPYFTDLFGNSDSIHKIGRKAAFAVDKARDLIADRMNVKAKEIYFTSGGTESDNWGIYSFGMDQAKLGKNHIILSSIEHHAVLSAGERLERAGCEVTWLKVDEKGKISIEELKKAITEKTGLVGIMMANNETGVIQPIKEAAEVAHQYNALFFTDAVQAAPYIRLYPKELGVDMLAFSGHKFYGPKGCGVLYIRNGIKIPTLISGGEQERGMRGGTLNVPSIVGIGEAYKKCVDNMEANNRKIIQYKNLFIERIKSTIDNIEINGEIDGLPSIVNLYIKGVNNVDFLYNMDLNGVAVSAGSACASASLEPSHTITAMKGEKVAKSSVRFSFGKDNTEEEIIKGVEIASNIVKKLRNF